jgi:hypothetical protein
VKDRGKIRGKIEKNLQKSMLGKLKQKQGRQTQKGKEANDIRHGCQKDR